MLAPIFTWEMRRTMQQRWFHAARVSFAAIMLLLFLWHLTELAALAAHPDFRRTVAALLWQTREFQHFFMAAHFSVIFLLAPILAAGAILLEKKRKTLELLLTTQQSSAHIILSHWLAAVVKLMILSSPTIPLLVWMHAFSEAGPITWIVAWIACTWLLVLPLTAWPIFVSVYVRRISTAWGLGYAGNVLLLLVAQPIFADAQIAFWRYAAFHDEFLFRFALFVAVPTVYCLTIAIWGLRPAFGWAPEREVRAAANRPTLEVSDQPILWKQTYCNALPVPRFVRWLPRWMRVALFIASTAGVAALLGGNDVWVGVMGVAILFTFPMAALIWASTTIGSEREANTWDSLRLTPLSADEIVNDTLQGITSRLTPYWRALLPALAVLIARNYVNTYVVLLWLVAGGAIYHAAIAGLHASFRMQSSWGAMLYAMATFGMFGVLFGWIGLIGAGLSFFTCFASGRALLRPPKEFDGILVLLVVVVNGCLFCVPFFATLYIMFRTRSTNLILATVQHLAWNEGFDRAAPARFIFHKDDHAATAQTTQYAAGRTSAGVAR